MGTWYAKVPGNDFRVRVERITYPSKGDVESSCLVQIMTFDGRISHPHLPPVRVVVRNLEMRMDRG